MFSPSVEKMGMTEWDCWGCGGLDTLGRRTHHIAVFEEAEIRIC